MAECQISTSHALFLQCTSRLLRKQIPILRVDLEAVDAGGLEARRVGSGQLAVRVGRVAERVECWQDQGAGPLQRLHAPLGKSSGRSSQN